jgi:hypothetical protein
LDNESDFLIAMSSLFHSLTVEGINDELVIECLQKGTIKLSPFRIHILSSPACSCGAPQEDANHFFFVCTKYSEIRNELFLSISDFNIAENSKRVKRNEEKVCVCVYGCWMMFG